VTGIAGLDRLPERGLILLAVTLLDWRHFIRFREIKYRIACHNAESIRRCSSVDHPDLAVKENILQDGLRAICTSVDARAYTI
jgi:hypothetical protein